MAIASINPATGQVLKTFEALTDSQIEEKLRRAAEAFCVYRKVPFSDRARKMVRAAEILEAQKETFGRLATMEMGKTFQSAVAEAVKCAWVCRFYAENAERFLADEVVATPAARSYVQYQPLGAILAVMPWNYPFWQVMRFAAPALMAGNVVLLKHASNVPQCALQVEELFRSAGFPPGVFQTLLVGRDKVGKLLDDPRVVAATLTGSETAGIEIGIEAAKRVKKVVLELGGTDPFIVMPSANLDVAVAVGVKARTANNGESCISAKRFILAEPIADEFESKFAQQMKSLSVGDPFEEGIDVGPLVNADAVAETRRLSALYGLAESPGLADALAATERGELSIVTPDSPLGRHVRAWLTESNRASWSLNDHSARHRMSDTERRRGYDLGWLTRALGAALQTDT